MFAAYDMNPIAIRHHFEERERRAERVLAKARDRKWSPASLLVSIAVLAVLSLL